MTINLLSPQIQGLVYKRQRGGSYWRKKERYSLSARPQA